MKKLTAFLLALILSVTAQLTACASSGDADKTTQKDSGDTVTSDDSEKSETDVSEETERKYYDSLPQMNLNGRKIRIISRETNKSHDVQQYTDFGNNEIDSEAIDGTQINDAVFNRNRELEARYNFVFESIQPNMNPAEFSKQSILADSDDYDVIIDALLPMTSLMGSQFLMNLNDFDHLDLNAACWDHNANSNLSVGQNHYLAIGDLLILDKKGTWSTLFNKELSAKYELDDIYQLVRDGKWTIDVMHEMSEKVSLDLNGDGKMTETDQWGYLTESYNANVHMFGSDTLFTSKDSDDFPVLSLYSDRSVSAFEKVLAFMTDENTTLNNSVSPNGASDTLKAFGEGRGLFYMVGIGTAMEYRYMDADFGIVPVPKYDEEQKNYYTTLSIYNSACLGIPVTNRNPDEVAFAIQAICLSSTDTLRKTFYDVVLNGVTVRDEESKDMLDIIFGNRVFDLGFTYSWGGIGNIYTKLISMKSNNLASAYKAIEKPAQKAIDNAIESFK